MSKLIKNVMLKCQNVKERRGSHLDGLIRLAVAPGPSRGRLPMVVEDPSTSFRLLFLAFALSMQSARDEPRD